METQIGIENENRDQEEEKHMETKGIHNTHTTTNPSKDTEKKHMETKDIHSSSKTTRSKDMEKKDMETKKKNEAEKKEEQADATRFIDALASVEGELAGIPEAELATINLDIGIATVSAIGCMGELRALHPALVRKFGTETGALVERLDLVARAASQANVDYYGTFQSVDTVSDKSKRAVEMRAVLFAITQVLIQRKVLPASVLDNVRGTGSFRNQAHDLQHLVSVLRRAMGAAAGVVSISIAELDSAEDAARDLVVAMGEREQAPPFVSEAAEKRQRAFTLFIRTYEELRAAINHLRWREKDVETILPSLYAGRGGRKKEEDVAPPVVVSPLPSPEVVSPSSEPVVVSRPSTPIRPGMPGADPFSPA